MFSPAGPPMAGGISVLPEGAPLLRSQTPERAEVVEEGGMDPLPPTPHPRPPGLESRRLSGLQGVQQACFLLG